MMERKGSIKAKVVGDTKRKTVMPIIRGNITLGMEIMTDEYLPYRSLTKEGVQSSNSQSWIKRICSERCPSTHLKDFGHNSKGQLMVHIMQFLQSIYKRMLMSFPIGTIGDSILFRFSI